MKLHSVLFALLAATGVNVYAQSSLYKKLDNYSATVSKEFDQINLERKEKINQIVEELNKSKTGTKSILFTSNDNSAASQLAQAWLQVAAERNLISSIQISSAGENETAINKDALKALKNAGFKISSNTTFPKNPRYMVSYSQESSSLLMFSKKYNNFQNPTSDFLSIGTEENLSSVNGETSKVELTYAKIDASNADTQSREIAREMFYLADKLQSKGFLSHQQ